MKVVDSNGNTKLNVNATSSTITVVDAGADTTCWPVLATSQTGSQSPASDAGLTFNASTNILDATGGFKIGGVACWQYADEQDASSSASLDFVSNFGTNYRAHLFVLSHVAPATDNVTFQLLTSTNGGSSFDGGASNYRWATWVYLDSTFSVAQGSTGDNSITLSGSCGNATNETTSGIIVLCNPSATQYGSMVGNLQSVDLNGNLVGRTFSAQRITAADVDAIQFKMSSGNIASGKITHLVMRA